jgi:prophage regulatory protein
VNEPDPIKLYRLRDLSARIGLARSAIYKAIQEGRFPKPVRIGARAVAWRHQDIEAWLQSRAAQRGDAK